eukprot:1940858-Alexandrium_andersonii.AAC.1
MTSATLRHTRQRQGRQGNSLRAVDNRAPRSGAGARRATRQSRAQLQDRAPRNGDVARCRQALTQQCVPPPH